MSKLSASTGADFVAGEHENVKVSEDGVVELSSKNRFPNATFEEFDGRGLLSQWGNITGPIKRVAWNVYARPAPSSSTYVAGTPFSRQNTSPLPLARSSYSQFAPLSDSGAPAPNTATRAEVDAPESSVLKSIPTSEAGLAEGYYGICLAWCVFSTQYPDRRFTGLSPRAAANVPLGSSPQKIAIDLYDSVPAGAVGLGVFATEPQATSGDALSAPVYLQGVVPTQSGDFLSSFDLTSLLKGELGTSTNDSYVGEFEAYDEPLWDLASSSDALIEAVDVRLQLSWSFRTEFGRSASQKIAPGDSTPSIEWIEVEGGKGSAVRLRPPVKPPGAIDWRPEWRGDGQNASGHWYTYQVVDPSRQGGDFSSYAYIFIADEGGAIQLQEGYILSAIDRSATDATGISTPDLAPPLLTVEAIEFPEDEAVEVVSTFDLENGTETAPSPSMTLTGLTPGDDTWRVYLPTGEGGGNLLSNPEFDMMSRSDDGSETELLDWTLAADLSWTTGEGEASLVDASALSSTVDAFYNEQKVEVAQGKDYCLRFDFETYDYTSGRVRVILRELLANGATNVNTVLVSHTADGEAFGTEASIGGVDADHPLDPDTAYLRLVIENNGSAAGVRDLSWTLSNAGIFEGLVAPRKRYTTQSGTVALPEENIRPYPLGAYGAIVENPPDSEKPEDLAGIDLNMIEFFAPPSQTLSDFLIARRLRIAIRPGDTYTLSAYLEGKGLSSEPKMLVSDIKDDSGVSLGFSGAEGELAILSGYSPYNRYAKTITPALEVNDKVPAYLEIVGNRDVGAGMLRIIAPQFENGVSATEFSTEVAEEGYVTLYFDMHVEDSDTVNALNSIAGIEQADIVATLRDPDAASVTALYASSSDNVTYSTDYADIADVPLARYIRVTVTLETA